LKLPAIVEDMAKILARLFDFFRFICQISYTENSAPCCSRTISFAVYANMTPLLLKAKAKDLRVSDADHQWVASAELGNIMHSTLSALPSDLRQSRPLYAFSLAVWRVTGKRYLLCGALRLFNDFSVILGPFCLRGFVTSMTPVYAHSENASQQGGPHSPATGTLLPLALHQCLLLLAGMQPGYLHP
jgi:hypothetical protein